MRSAENLGQMRRKMSLHLLCLKPLPGHPCSNQNSHQRAFLYPALKSVSELHHRPLASPLSEETKLLELGSPSAPFLVAYTHPGCRGSGLHACCAVFISTTSPSSALPDGPLVSWASLLDEPNFIRARRNGNSLIVSLLRSRVLNIGVCG